MFDTAMTLMVPQSVHAGTWEEFMAKLKRHYAPAPSRIARRQHFYHRDQAPGETINQYVTALRRAARHCEFVNLEDYLLDRLVSGVRDQNLKRRLIVNHELTFQMALDEACAAELASLSIAELPRGQSPPKQQKEALVVNETNEPYFSDSDCEDDICRVHGAKAKASGHNPLGRGFPRSVFVVGETICAHLVNLRTQYAVAAAGGAIWQESAGLRSRSPGRRFPVRGRDHVVSSRHVIGIGATGGILLSIWSCHPTGGEGVKFTSQCLSKANPAAWRWTRGLPPPSCPGRQLNV